MSIFTVDNLDIISPAYAEERNVKLITSQVEELVKSEDTNYQLILVVNNHDPTRTPKIADRLETQLPFVSVIHRKAPPAFGGAIKQGMKKSSGDAVVFMMSDLSDEPQFIPSFVEQLEDGYDIVYGSRFKEESNVENYNVLRLMFNRMVNYFCQWFFQLNSNDLTNAFKAYRRNVIDSIGIDNLKSDSFSILLELPLKAHFLGFTHTEIPVTWEERVHGESRNTIRREGVFYLKRLFEFVLRSFSQVRWSRTNKRREFRSKP